jgi:hypothetical protein
MPQRHVVAGQVIDLGSFQLYNEKSGTLFLARGQTSIFIPIVTPTGGTTTCQRNHAGWQLALGQGTAALYSVASTQLMVQACTICDILFLCPHSALPPPTPGQCLTDGSCHDHAWSPSLMLGPSRSLSLSLSDAACHAHTAVSLSLRRSHSGPQQLGSPLPPSISLSPGHSRLSLPQPWSPLRLTLPGLHPPHPDFASLSHDPSHSPTPSQTLSRMDRHTGTCLYPITWPPTTVSLSHGPSHRHLDLAHHTAPHPASLPLAWPITQAPGLSPSHSATPSQSASHMAHHTGTWTWPITQSHTQPVSLSHGPTTITQAPEFGPSHSPGHAWVP